MNNIRTLIYNIRLGVVKANSLRTLPERWDNFNNHIIIRIIRVIMGFITVIGLININHEVIIVKEYGSIIKIISIINIIYIVSVSITRLIFIIKILYNKEYQVKNSPINRIATSAGQVWLCIKGVCVFVSSSGGVLGGLALYDSVLGACMIAGRG
jgi:hypothetical protein